jgi:hypothetical protein
LDGDAEGGARFVGAAGRCEEPSLDW